MTSERREQTSREPTESQSRDPLRRRVLRRLWRAETFYMLGLLSFIILALFAHFTTYFKWDLRLSQFSQSLDAPGVLAFMRAVSFVGNDWHPYALASLTIIVLFAFRFRSEAAGLALSTGGSTLLNRLVKIVIARPRPSTGLVTVFSDLETRSFPSGHVTFYVCYFGFLFFVAYAVLPRGSLARRMSLVLLALPVVFVGLSRVYLGAHWPSDTLGAYLFSGLWLGLSLEMYRRWKQRMTINGCETEAKNNSATDGRG